MDVSKSRTRERLQRNAVKAGIRAAARLNHIPDKKEFRSLKVQVVPLWLRLSAMAVGVGLFWAGLSGWPLESNAVQGVFGIGGILLVVFGLVGVRRTLEEILDRLAPDVAGEILWKSLQAVAEAVDL